MIHQKLFNNIIILLLFFNVNLVFSQKGDPDLALSHMSTSNFDYALDEYQLLLKEFPDNVKYNYNLAVCYLNTNIDKTKAITYLEKVIELNENRVNSNVYYLLGRAYHFNYDFDQAIKFFSKYINIGGGTASTIAETKKQIEYCNNAKELIRYPLNVKFENLGENINSSFADYFPFLPEDETYIVFNSKRPMYSEKYRQDEVPNSNVFVSHHEKGAFQKAKLIDANINSEEGTEEIVGLASDGSFKIIYLNNTKVKSDLYLLPTDSMEATGLIKLDETINSSGAEIAACISKDKTVLIFASNQKGGYGGTDLYLSRKLPIGGWGPAVNLGPKINTPFDEDFPNLTSNDKQLLFSSKGHASMGGYDIFKCSINLNKLEIKNVRNIGYPINSVFDDMNLRLSESKRHGYISALRPEGFGDFDVYKITFNDIETKFTLLKGYVNSSSPTKMLHDVIIDVSDVETGKLYGTYLPNQNTSRYVMILPPGNYKMLVESQGFEVMSKTISVFDNGSYEQIVDQDIILAPLK